MCLTVESTSYDLLGDLTTDGDRDTYAATSYILVPSDRHIYVSVEHTTSYIRVLVDLSDTDNPFLLFSSNLIPGIADRNLAWSLSDPSHRSQSWVLVTLSLPGLVVVGLLWPLLSI